LPNKNDPDVRPISPLTEAEPGHSLFAIDEASMVGDREPQHQQPKPQLPVIPQS
jgi:hypothetical protein